jgi:hypothetical protein
MYGGVTLHSTLRMAILVRASILVWLGRPGSERLLNGALSCQEVGVQLLCLIFLSGPGNVSTGACYLINPTYTVATAALRLGVRDWCDTMDSLPTACLPRGSAGGTRVRCTRVPPFTLPKRSGYP